MTGSTVTPAPSRTLQSSCHCYRINTFHQRIFRSFAACLTCTILSRAISKEYYHFADTPASGTCASQLLQRILGISEVSALLGHHIMQASGPRQPLLRKRLLDDTAELHRNPYPGTRLRFQDASILDHACLILQPADESPLHLTINFHNRYPLEPPEIVADHSIAHPNIFSGYVCASIRNTKQSYAAAYTLKSICIQMLCIFGSEYMEDVDTVEERSLSEWKEEEECGWSRIRTYRDYLSI